jgi:hypothetical protein
MRAATNVSIVTRVAALWAATTIAAACSQTPTSPSQVSGGVAGGNGTAASNAVATTQGTTQTWQDFQARGWNCRTPNNGPVTVCSPPNQPLPTVAIPPAQPPADRPETVLLKRWRDGVFEANVLLIRPEIYNGQMCEPAGTQYSYITVLGYYECAHYAGS